MPRPLFVLTLLLALPAGAESRIFVLDFEGGAVAAEELDAMEQRLSEGIARRRDLAVTTGTEVRELIELESSRQSVGCDDDLSCLSELAGAVGARYLLTGRVAKVGALTIVQLALIDTTNATTLARRTVEGGDSRALFAQMRTAGERLVEVIPAPELRAPAGWSATGHIGVTLLALGGAAAAVGAWPAVDFALGQRELDVAAARFAAEATPAALDAAVGARARVDGAASAWSDWGMITTLAGGAAVALGLVLTTTGYGVGSALAEPVE